MAGGSSSKWASDEFIAFVVVIITWSYVAVRASLVPFVQDEAHSFWLYAHAEEFLPFLSHTDAGNHFLSSLFGVIGYKLFGFSTLGIRWGSVVSFPIYAWGCWMLVKSFKHPLLWCSFLALIWCPFLLDFFSMFRGYGPAMAGWVWSLYGLISFVRFGGMRPLAVMIVAASLTLFANLSLLPACTILFCLSVLVLFVDRRRYGTKDMLTFIGALVVFGSILAFAAFIALDLQEKGLLYLGSSQGLMSETVHSLIDAVFSSRSPVMDWALVTPVLFAIAIAIWFWVRKREWRSPFTLLVAILFLEVISKVAMYRMLGINYPHDRAALQWLPLYILVVAHAIEVLGRSRYQWYWASALLLIFPLRTVATLNTDRLVSAYEQAMPIRYIHEVAELHAQLGRPILLSGLEQFPPCWAFHQAAVVLQPIEMRSNVNAGDPDDARIISKSRLEEFKEGYHIADSSSSGVLLLIRDVPFTWTLVSDTILPSMESDEEWIHLPITCPTDTAGLSIVFNANIAADGPISNIMLVLEVKDSTGAYIRYETVELRHWPQLASGTDIEVARFLPVIPVGGKCDYYLWNIRRTRFRISEAHIRTMRVQRPSHINLGK